VSITQTHHFGFRKSGRGMFGGLLMTLAIHGVILGMAYWSQVRGPAHEEAVRDVIVTKMVTLGKQREKFWLPRIVEPPPPKIEQPVIKLNQDPEKPPTPPEPPKPDQAVISPKDPSWMKRAKLLRNAAHEEPPEGSPLGSTAGTASQAEEGDAYASQIAEAIKRNWNAPTGLVSDAELSKLTVPMRIRIAEDGSVLEPKMQKSSGNQFFDDSVVQAIKATPRVPPPPPAVRAMYKRGAVLEFAGSDLAH
jgi:colicin import membrane protein/protein TonB